MKSRRRAYYRRDDGSCLECGEKRGHTSHCTIGNELDAAKRLRDEAARAVEREKRWTELDLVRRCNALRGAII